MLQCLYYGGAMKIKFQKVDQGEVDGEMWYTIRTSDRDVSTWLRRQERTLRVETTVNYPNYFDIHEQLYVMLGLKYT
jgi:hypothetical protein